MDFLKSAVASAISKGPPFPYTFGDRVTLDQSIWALYNGTRKEDGSDCSIFTFDIAASKSRLPLARNAVRKMRTLRHPGVLRVYDTVESDTYIYIATERVTPLEWFVRRKSLSAETSKWGLHTVANTISFINDEAFSVHGNVRLTSVYTSQSGEWRLGGFEILSSMREDDAVIYAMGSITPDSGKYAPPEVAKSGWDTIKRHPLSATDSYGFALLVLEVFNGCLINSDLIGQTKNMPPTMHQSYKRLLNQNPKARLSVSHFKEQGRRSGSFFDTPLIKLSEGIESLGLKDDGERERFLSELDEVASEFPEEFFSAKVLPELLKSVEFGGGGPKVFASVMKIGARLPDEEYNLKLTPVIVRLFANPDRAIRVCLLDHLPNMIEHLPQKIVNDKIFPQMVTGFADIAPVVREQTVKAVLTIISKLSDRTINGELLKYLAKTSNDEQPGIRTNTTICLGKIARSLGANTRQKVLIAAFCRSLRDPFVHARNAALVALAATSDLFTEDDCATKVLPALCPSLIDKEKLVRDQASKTFDVYMLRIRKHATTLPDSALPPVSKSANGAMPRIGTPQNDTGWAGWAISSFTNKLATASGEMQAKPTNAKGTVGEARPSSAPSDKSTVRPPVAGPVSQLHRQAVTGAPAPVLTRTTTDQFFTDAQDEDDEIDLAWGDTDEDFFDAPLQPEAAIETQPLVPASRFDDGGEPDFEGWLKAQAVAKSKPPLPKGLSKPFGLTNGRQNAIRSTTTGHVGSGSGAKKLAQIANPASKVTAPKTIDTKPKEPSEDDDWGDAWD
ncbi:Nuclear aminoacylation-dependent tRNA export pathway component [Xanthoria calcicola]